MSDTNNDKNPAAKVDIAASTANRNSSRSVALFLCVAVAVYLVLQMWVLPKMGVAT